MSRAKTVLALGLASARNWHSALSVSEKRLLKIAAVLLGGAIFYVALFAPLRDWRDLSWVSYQREVETFRWLRDNPPNPPLNPPLEKGASSGLDSQVVRDGQALLAMVTASAGARNLRFSRVRPEGDAAVSLVLEGVLFADFIRWLDATLSGMGAQIRQLRIDAASESGRVNVRLVLETQS